MSLIWAHRDSERVLVARLVLGVAALWVWSHPGRLGVTETSGKLRNLKFAFCDQVFSEHGLDGQDIGWGATQILVYC